VTEELTSKEYWDKHTGGSSAARAFSELFSRYLKKSSTDRIAIEIGCVPGKFLGYVCKYFGYFPEGVDFLKDADEITGKTLRKFGLAEYEIYTEDFLKWKADKEYDLVMSFGFIEHFQNPDEVLKKHIDILKKGGMIILEVPNFANGQRLLHYLLDRENLSKHNINVMNKSYFKIVAQKFNLKIAYLGYYGGLFHFWWENNNPTNIQKKVYSILMKIDKFTSKIDFCNKYFSPFLLMIAKKE
jgi:cyclopropane fatty-acyl-phospholipid synthase-like methyltransferase